MANKYTKEDLNLLCNMLLYDTKSGWEYSVATFFVDSYIIELNYDSDAIERELNNSYNQGMYHNYIQKIGLYLYSFMFIEHLEDMPLYINDEEYPEISVIARWRLHVGK